MKLLSVQPRALLIQDIQAFLYILQQAIKGSIEQITRDGLTEQGVIDWIMREQIERVYNLFTTNHDSNDWKYACVYYQVRNRLDLDHLTGQYVQVPKLYGDNCYIDLEVRGIDLFMWYYKHERVSAASYNYERKWN